MFRVILAIACLTALPALAATPDAARPDGHHTIDMMTVMTDIHGKPIIDFSQVTPADPKCEKCGPLTLGTVVASALLTDKPAGPGQLTMSAIDKAKHGILAMQLLDNKAAVLSAAEASEIIALLNVWSPLVVARAVPLIDPNALK
jgi:hypothetical protein